MKSRTDYKGAISAIPTPFLNKQVDFESLKKMIEFQLKGGICGFVVNGTTAESPTLSWEEVEKIYKLVREIAGTRVPVIVGTGSNSTDDTVETTQKAEKLGADAALVVVPYYNKPPQRGLVAHFTEVATNANLPIVMYNVPGRTITGMTAETIAELTKVKNIFAIKEASGDIAFDEKLKPLVPADFVMLSGDDPTYPQFLKLGGSGVISVMSNVIPAECARWYDMAQSGKWGELEADFGRYKKFISQMYLEANPIPLKWIMYKMGLFKSPEMRLPLVALDSVHHEPLAGEMKTLGLI
ncbi:4-hydroxy-tetrahydrodipicolinate synthase [Pseudobdellovibrio exovorus]|uniref:4-hydroxy-tetrahydrodipicolinate synthase n=1 Tax=Pseudobdellovibrio exovorus JSS TaxID=1184267 RepID=M4VMG9_9BACT|nr:4-hydroxy-tetrahydrodipicolinate synthase [Pseudobdellovibrio exovorus]AGH94279.1 dihydrodipicolinate synthase [Pseudobdellovibrio exovorus JSS]